MAAASCRPCRVPAHRCERSPRIASGAIAPDCSDPIRSPASSSATGVSIQSSARAIAASSVSRIVGVNPPTRSTCVPGASHSPRISGPVDAVAQLTTSARPTAASRSVSTVAARPCSRLSTATARAALAESRPQMPIDRSGRTEACAAARCGASRPVPTTSSREASVRASNEAPSADTAAVRRTVSSPPSMIAIDSPLAASLST